MGVALGRRVAVFVGVALGRGVTVGDGVVVGGSRVVMCCWAAANQLEETPSVGRASSAFQLAAAPARFSNFSNVRALQ